MSLLLNRRLARLVISRSSGLTSTTVRAFGAHADPEVEKEEAFKWKKIAAVMSVGCLLFGIYNVLSHHHHDEAKVLPYGKIRNKPYPWRQCPDCNYFDQKCWNECKGISTSDGHHH